LWQSRSHLIYVFVHFRERFGVHWVNFTDAARPRYPKKSAGLLTQIFADNGFPEPKQ
jgi:beta-glucosidase/6-phospho-beta-glucosidase/beta-galactosidase